MIKGLKTVTIGIIILLVFVSLFAVFTHTVSAGWKQRIADLYRVQPQVLIEYDQEIADDPFLPVDRKKIIPVNVKIRIVGEYAKYVIPEKFDTKRVIVFVNIIEKPEWCTANIIPYVLDIYPTTSWKQNSCNLTIIVDENAPAFSYGTIKIEAKVEPLSIIDGATYTSDIHFKPGYLPILKLNVPETTYSFTNPDDEATFTIEIENLGNAKTLVSSHIIDVPEGWIAYIEPNVLIGTSLVGDIPKKTLQLIVKPSNDFGYHNEREVIQISINPSYYGDSSLKGKEYLLSFIVQSRGFTTPGFGLGLVMVALIGISLVIKRQHRKNSSKTNRGGKK